MATPQSPESPVGNPQSRIRILYAEDNQKDADLTRAALAAHAPEFDVEIVGTGQACLDRMRETGVDLLLLDYRLPDIDGLDVLKTLVHAGVHVPVVMVTGVGDEELVVKALRMGAASYVPKFGDYLATLADLLRDVVEEYRRRQGQGLDGTASNRRILYVEHHSMDVELTLRHLAESAPHLVMDVVHTCGEALARLEQPHAYDLVLVDLRMPDQSGLDFVREARLRRLVLPPFIIISGKGDEAAAVATLKLGAADYVVKREGYLDQLPYTIEQAIAHHHLRRLNQQLQVELAERGEAERALRASEVRYRDLFFGNPNPMWVYDLESLRFLAVNDAAVARYGYSQHELLSMTIQDTRPREDLPRLQENIAHAPQHGLEQAGLWRHRRRDGSLIDVEIASHTLDFSARPAKLVLAHDVTARLQAEQALREGEVRFRATFEQAAVGLAHVALDGRWLLVNQRLCDIVGYSREELLETTFQAITYPDDLAPDLENARRLLAAEISTYSVEKRYVRKDGSLVWINLTVSLVRERSGEPGYFISVVEDISQRKQGEEAQGKLEAQFQQAQKMESVGRLAGGVAHDFNNMLTVVRGYAEMVVEKLPAGDPLLADIGEIRLAADRSTALVQQLLAFARKQAIAPQVLDLNDTLAGMLKMIGRLIGEDIDLAWVPGHDVGLVYMDPAQIHQILVNLAVNARDAIGGNGRVTVETANAEVTEAYCASHVGSIPGPFVQLTVSDNGCGMDAETRTRIFEPFFTTKPQGQGTGLGLATVYGIVTQNRGFINAYSEPGHGTTFTIYLPRHAEQPAAVERAVQGAATPTGTETVLLVEDDAALLKLARRMLEQLGYAVVAAGSPNEAIELAASRKAALDLLMTDMIMPEMTGRALWEQLAPLRPSLKCLFMSGYTADVISHQGAIEAGVHFLQKPFSADTLARKIREVLES
ncbi:MAG: response regulator [Acidobacteria bacterium]|nr:response regulator [Acidobacteriota bacterium]